MVSGVPASSRSDEVLPGPAERRPEGVDHPEPSTRTSVSGPADAMAIRCRNGSPLWAIA